MVLICLERIQVFEGRWLIRICVALSVGDTDFPIPIALDRDHVIVSFPPNIPRYPLPHDDLITITDMTSTLHPHVDPPLNPSKPLIQSSRTGPSNFLIGVQPAVGYIFPPRTPDLRRFRGGGMVEAPIDRVSMVTEEKKKSPFVLVLLCPF